MLDGLTAMLLSGAGVTEPIYLHAIIYGPLVAIFHDGEFFLEKTDSWVLSQEVLLYGSMIFTFKNK